METEINGTVKKIDTCVTASTDEELQKKIAALNLDLPGAPVPPIPPVAGTPPTPPLPPDLPEIRIEIDSTPGEGTSYSYSKVIEINDGDDGTNKGKKSILALYRSREERTRKLT